MSEKEKHKYLVTLRWYVETDEELVVGSHEADEKILDILRHRIDGSRACKRCPTRHNKGYAVLEHHDFMGDKPVYMSTDKVEE